MIFIYFNITAHCERTLLKHIKTKCDFILRIIVKFIAVSCHIIKWNPDSLGIWMRVFGL